MNLISISHDQIKNLSIGYNLGYTHFINQSGFLKYSIAFGTGLSKKIGLFIETYGEIEKSEMPISNFDSGFTYLVKDNLQIDLSFGLGINNKMNFHCIADLIYFLNIHRALETRPNVAPTAIFELINYDIKNIHLMGVTFFKDGWDKGYKEGEYKKERALDGHAQEVQIHLLKLILENESKFTMDKEIETLIYNK